VCYPILSATPPATALISRPLTEAHLAKILSTPEHYETVGKYANRATAQEIAANDYNFNISRYVDTFNANSESIWFSFKSNKEERFIPSKSTRSAAAEVRDALLRNLAG